MKTDKKSLSLICLGAALLIGAGIASCMAARSRRRRREQDAEAYYFEIDEADDERDRLL